MQNKQIQRFLHFSNKCACGSPCEKIFNGLFSLRLNRIGFTFASFALKQGFTEFTHSTAKSLLVADQTAQWYHRSYRVLIKKFTLCKVESTIIFSVNISMTSLLKHNVAHSSRHSFRPKTNNQPLKKLLSLAFS